MIDRGNRGWIRAKCVIPRLPLRISLRRNAPNYLRWVDRQQRHVFCFFTLAPFISANTIRYRIWHIYQRTMFSPDRPILYFPSSPPIARRTSFSNAPRLLRREFFSKKRTWLILGVTSPRHNCSFCAPRPSTRWPGIIELDAIRTRRDN